MEEFPRIKRLPPYVFNVTGELKLAARRRASEGGLDDDDVVLARERGRGVRGDDARRGFTRRGDEAVGY